MPAPHNPVKAAMAEGRTQFGLWLSSTHPTLAEIGASAGFDWCLIDCEHSPNDAALVQSQLQAMSGGDAAAVVRIPVGDSRIVKQMLDLGLQTILVPMVNTADEARAMVRASRYPPEGIRGVGASIARATGYGANRDYLRSANDEICVIVQAETREALDNIDQIAAVEGVDCVFLGPSDISASMGHLDDPDHPDVQAAIRQAATRIRAAGKAVGLLTFDPTRIGAMAEMGGTFIAVGGDITILADALRARAAEARRILRP